MPEHDLISIFITRFNRLNVTYFVTGAVASIIYGEPRLTHDLDLVIEISKGDIAGLITEFPLEEFYCPPEEIINVEMNRQQRGHFNLIHHATGFKADVYLSGRDQLQQWAIDNRQCIDYEGESLWLAPIEYVILKKLEYYQEGRSEKHLRDIQSMLEVSFSKIDSVFLENKIQELNLVTEWQKLKS